MPTNLSALSTLTTTATELANLILVSPQKDRGITPQLEASSEVFPESFLFDVYGDQSVNLESDITDHYVEDNTARQDQISLKPDLVTIRGYVSELNDVVPPALEPLKTAALKLNILVGYVPQLSVTANLVYAQAFQAYQVARLAQGAAVNAWGTVNGDVGLPAEIVNGRLFVGDSIQNKQQLAFQKFYGYWSRRTLFTVQTPWAIFKNMAIYRLRALQPEDTRVITDFEIIFKPIRYAETRRSGQVDFGQGRFNDQASVVVDGGVNTPPPVTDSLSSLFPSLGGG